MKKLLVITGPTAAGKTGLGIALTQTLGGEVVSADSMQVYRGMNIGTAKPTAEEMAGVMHHMIDVAAPEEPYSVARYVVEAATCVDDILARGKLPILVGGTGLYIDSLLSGRTFAPQAEGLCKGDRPRSPVFACETNLEQGAIEDDRPYERLQQIDPETAARLHPNDKKRVLRALEVYRLTGQTMTAHNEATQRIPPRYEAVKIALTARDRKDLYRRIDSRVDGMIEAGLQREVECLLQGGGGRTAMQAIGYKEIAQAVRGEISMDEAVMRIKQESRRYAKRQLSWLRRDPAVRWIDWAGEPDLAAALRVSTEICRAEGLSLQ